MTYVTIASDQVTGTVLHVGKDRKKGDLKAWYESLTLLQRTAIESISMDMWPAYINATLDSIPEAKNKIAFDKFHVAKYLGGAVDKVRRQEHKALMADGYDDLKGSKYHWLYNPKNMTYKQKRRFAALRNSALKTARAWAIKELAMSLWHYVSKTWAKKAWARWLSWAMRSRLEPVKKVAKTIKAHLWGILRGPGCIAGAGYAGTLRHHGQPLENGEAGGVGGMATARSLRQTLHLLLGGWRVFPGPAGAGQAVLPGGYRRR